jgi:hypothetical protein
MSETPAVSLRRVNEMGAAADPRRDRVKSAYRAMATAARFRPKAPSDGFGNIEWGYDLEDPKLLTLEALEAAKEFEQEDNACEHRIHGCVTANHAGALYLVLRAADLLCFGGSAEHSARETLRLALRELDGVAEGD